MNSSTDKWSDSEAGQHYAQRRFGSARAARRDPTIVARLLARHGVRGAVLDAPCGTGRLWAELSRAGAPVHGLDVSASMLAVAARAGYSSVTRGDLARLPFPSRSFDVVVSCRYLHHLRNDGDLAHALSELVRISDRLVIASFWDAHSLPALRVRWRLKRAESRRAVRLRTIAAMLEANGARMIDVAHSFRFVSQQTFFVAERG